jgi:hypothetical protein
MATTQRDRGWHRVQRTSYEVGGLPLALRRDVSRELRAHVSDLSPAESQFLSDFDRGRYPMVGLTRLIGIARRATERTIAVSLSDAIRSLILSGRADDAQIPLVLLDAETDANYHADKAEDQYRITPRCDVSRRALIAKLRHQAEVSTAAADRLEQEGGR